MTKSQNTKNEQLTEQFNHGLLPDGWYYYKASDGRSDIATEYGLFCIEADNKVKVEVLAEVPSYEEHMMTKDCVKTVFEAAQRETILKELLKECRHIIGIEKDFGSCHFSEYKLVELLAKIDEVLK